MAATEGAQRTDDEAILHRLGYAQVLYREMGGFSNFAISFTIISILAGCLTSYYIAFNNGGPIAITWGWLIVGAFCVLVSMSMGEIASSMPTAGALYFWASKLGGPAWGWFTGWFNLVGQIAVTASIQYGSALFATALLNLWFPDAVGTDTGAVFITLTVIVALQLGLNLLNVNLLALLNTVSAWWHMVGVVVIVGILAVIPDNHQSAGFVFGEVINNSGFSDTAIVFVFGLGLLMAQYTITGYDASAHMSEETRQASRASALGMVMSVVVSVVFGFILLVAVTFAVPDVQGTLDAAGNAVVYIWTESLGETWAEFLLFIAVVAQLFCGTASVTSASRMMFAFSRDRAVPFSTLWRKVAANRVPVNAVTAISVLAWALMIPTLANGVVGYAVGTSIAVIGLYIAFALPIILRIKAAERFEKGAWSLGDHYKWIAPVSVAWIALVCVLFLMPLSPKGIPGAEDFSWESVNYAPITVFGALVLFGGWYLLSARNWFTGPVREAGSEEELQSIEKQLDAEAHRHTGPGAATAATAAAATATAVAVAEKDDEADEAEPASKTEAEPASKTEAEPASKTEPDGDADGDEPTATSGAAEADPGPAAEGATTEETPASADSTGPADEDAEATATSDTATSDTATSDTAVAADTATSDTAVAADAATDDAPAAATPSTTEAAQEPVADAGTGTPVTADEPGDRPDEEGGASSSAAPAAAGEEADADAAATADEAAGAPVTTEAEPAQADPDLRAQLKEELKAELKAELRAELLEELRREATTNGSVPTSTTGTDAGASA
ncbi:amino acid permease [Pseudonocardia adelaidensis]|uniref:Amino acid transporter n=1 Tax=Pseudonocardia adelaidensis TaxID=648754 RepID=A0ABP9NGY9_9PSEU